MVILYANKISRRQSSEEHLPITILRLSNSRNEPPKDARPASQAVPPRRLRPRPAHIETRERYLPPLDADAAVPVRPDVKDVCTDDFQSHSLG